MPASNPCSKFLKTTSAKGIPRAMNSESAGFKFFWILSTLCVFSYGFYSVATLLMKYFQYGNIITIDEAKLNTEDMSVYPALTVCDKNPIRNFKMRDQSASYSLKNYHAKVNGMIDMAKLLDNSKSDVLEGIRLDLLTTRGYFQSLLEEEVDQVSHEESSFIIDCKALYYGLGKGSFKKLCGRNIAIEKHVIPEYMNCFEVSFTNETGIVPGGDAIIGFELTLFLDNYVPWKPEQLMHYNFFDQTESGIRATLHYPGKEYFTFATSVDAQPGTSTTISLIHRERTRLGEPYSDCSTSAMFGTNISLNPEVTCGLHCLETKVEEACHCIPILERPILARPENISFCKDINVGLEQLINNIRCVEIARLTNALKCFNEICKKACHELTWTRTSHSSKWPTVNQVHAFLKLVAAKEEFPYSDEINNASFTELRDFVENNFLQIRYSLDDNRYLRINDIPEMSSVDLFSALGGALNLWTGITVFLFIELVELGLKVFTNFIRPKQEPNANNRVHSITVNPRPL